MVSLFARLLPSFWINSIVGEAQEEAGIFAIVRHFRNIFRTQKSLNVHTTSRFVPQIR